jgi:hypothetical protein
MSNCANTSFKEKSQWRYESARQHFHSKKALRAHSALGTCVMISCRSSTPHYWDYNAVWTLDTGPKFAISCPSLCRCTCLCLCLCPCPVCAWSFFFIYIYIFFSFGAMNISSDIAIILSFPKECTRWRGTLKGLSHESARSKSAANLSASSLEIYRLIPLSAKQISMDSPFKLLKPVFCNCHSKSP